MVTKSKTKPATSEEIAKGLNKTQTEKKSFGQKLVENLPFHNFEENNSFAGCYRRTTTLGDKPENKFDVNVFADVKTGEEVFVTDSYSIKKSIQEAKAKFPDDFNSMIFMIEFLGKTEVNGKPFNQFNISVGTLEEYENFIK